jgi:putative transposase
MSERMVHRAYRYRMTPTAEQAARFAQITGTVRFVYNLALEQRETWWRQYKRHTGRHISYFGQSGELTQLRAEVDWIAGVPREALDQALGDLDRAYRAFFTGRAAHPSPRKRGRCSSFRLRGRTSPIRLLNDRIATVRLQGVGWVRFRLSRPIAGMPKTVTINEERGHWFVSFSTVAESDTGAIPSAQVGIDRGVANTVALSTGELLSLPAAIEAVDRRRRKAQRVLARRKPGSVRRGKQRARVATLYARARYMRADWLHRVSTDLTRRYGLIAIEALNVRSMTASAVRKGAAQKRGLNRSILSQGWHQFERMLAYKLEATGGTLIRVPAAYTSQTCSACGAVDARSRESQAKFCCVHCGHADHADTNAAKEILRRSTSAQLVEGARWRPDEARTTGVAA